MGTYSVSGTSYVISSNARPAARPSAPTVTLHSECVQAPREWTQRRRHKVTTGFVPGQVGIHFFIMRVNANEHNLNEAWLNYSIGRQSKKNSKEALQREAGEPRRGAGNWPSHFLPQLSHHSTPLLFFCFVYQ